MNNETRISSTFSVFAAGVKSAVKTARLFAVTLTAVLFLAGCGDSSDKSSSDKSSSDLSSPEDVAKAFATAIFKGDEATIEKFTFPDARESVVRRAKGWSEELEGAKVKDVKVEKASEDFVEQLSEDFRTELKGKVVVSYVLFAKDDLKADFEVTLMKQSKNSGPKWVVLMLRK